MLAPTASFWRVEHNDIKYVTLFESKWDSIGVSPYTCLVALPKLFPYDLHDSLWKNEPAMNPLKFKNKEFSIKELYKRPLPVSWVSKRPAAEDPYLREFWNNCKLLYGREKLFQIPYIFGFQSIEQLKNWFFDSNENSLMSKCGFLIRKYRSKYCIHGYRQSIMPVTKSFEIIGEQSL